MDNNETSELPPQVEEKKRHGCLTACLILMILGSVLTVLGNLSAAILIRTILSLFAVDMKMLLKFTFFSITARKIF